METPERDLPIPGTKRPGRLFLIALAIVGAAALPYAGVLDGPLVFDDVKLVAENELLRVEGKEAFGRLFSIFDISSDAWEESEVRENYRPLRFLSYWVDYRLSRAFLGGFPAGEPPVLFFHLQNILWHALNALLLFVVGRRLFGSDPPALVLALIFALHPLETEAVSYISGRRDVLSTFFFLAALALHLRSDAAGRLCWTSLLFAPALFACGFLAKEMVITLPAVALAADVVRRARVEPRRIAGHLALWGIAAVFVALTLSNKELIAEPVGGDRWSTLLTAPRYVMRYLALALLPLSQSIDYSFDAIPPSTGLLAPATTLFSIAGVLSLAGVALRLGLGKGSRFARLAGFGIAWFLVSLTPVLQIVPIPERFAERFAYLPSIGVFLCVTALGVELARAFARAPWPAAGPLRSRLAAGALAALLLVLFAATVARNRAWQSKAALWGSAVAAEPRSARAHLGYGNALKEEGRFAEAAEEYTRALEIWRENPSPSSLQHGLALQARMFRGASLAQLGAKGDDEALARAIDDLREVLGSTDTDGKEIGTSPEYTAIRHELAVCLVKEGRLEAARDELERIVEIGEPAARVAQAHYLAAKTHLMQRDIPGAVAAFRRAVAALPPGDPARCNVMIEIADVLENLARDPDAAWEVLRKAEELDPSDPVRVGILLRMARLLDREGEIESSIDKLEEALAIDPENSAVLVTLAGIETNLGRHEEAAERYRTILRRDPAHREAREALKALEVRRRVGQAEESAEARNAETLRGLLSRARKHRRRMEYVAARDVYARLARTAGELGEREIVAIACCGMAEIESSFGRRDAARRALEEAEKVLPHRPETLLRLAEHHLEEESERARARDFYLRYLDALGPEEAPEPRALFELAVLRAPEDPRLALEHLLRARELGLEEELGEEAYRVDRHLGRIYADLGEWRKAFDALQRYVDAAKGLDETERERAIAYLNERVIPRLLELDEPADPSGR